MASWEKLMRHIKQKALLDVLAATHDLGTRSSLFAVRGWPA